VELSHANLMYCPRISGSGDFQTQGRTCAIQAHADRIRLIAAVPLTASRFYCAAPVISVRFAGSLSMSGFSVKVNAGSCSAR
jgi:hypothetical protein